MDNVKTKTSDLSDKFIITFEVEDAIASGELKRILTRALNVSGIDKYKLTVQSEKDFNDNCVVGGEGKLQPHASLDSLFGDEFSRQLESLRH